jgi:Gpi18-like mannosyltransferase
LRGYFSYRYLIIFGIVIRLMLVPFFAHPFDMFAWYSYVDSVLNDGVFLSAIGFPPIWQFLLIPVAYLYGWLSNILDISVIQISSLPPNFDPSYGITVVTDPLFNTLVKIPLIVADLISAFLIYRIAYRFSGDISISQHSAVFYFLSPIVIWISAAWGQYDSLAVLFTLLSFYFLLVTKRFFLSSVSLYIAFLIKVYPIIFLVPIIALILKFETAKRWKLFSYLVFLIPISLYPVIVHGIGTFSFFETLVFPSNFLFTSGYGLTYWSISLIMQTDIAWSRLLMYILTTVFILLSSYYVFKRADKSFNIIIHGSFLLISSLFLSLTIVLEQRVLIMMALLSLVMIYHPSLRKYVLSLSFLAFLFAQKNFPFYLLPLASRYPDMFSFLFSSVSSFINRTPVFIAPSFSSGLILFTIGTTFSAVLIIIIWKIFFDNYTKRWSR